MLKNFLFGLSFISFLEFVLVKSTLSGIFLGPFHRLLFSIENGGGGRR